MKNERESTGFLLLLFLLLPWLFTVIFQGRQACPVTRTPSVEEYLPAVTAAQIPWNYPKEAIKAQTVLARSTLLLQEEEEEKQKSLGEISGIFRETELNWQALEKFHAFREAAKETQGQVLCLEGEILELPYHYLSSGRTREGKEVLGEDFTYLPSVDTAKDLDSPLYVEGCYFTVEELTGKIEKEYPGFSMGEEPSIEIEKTDAAGYVLEIQMGNQSFQGEKIRELLELPSSCFTVQILGDEIRFLCKGMGHGMGMSQYTAAQLALEGKTYKEILQYFFPQLEIVENK